MSLQINFSEDISELKFPVGSVIKTKKVKTSELLMSLSGINGLSTPLLPPGTRYFNKTKELTTVLIEVPPTIREIEYVSGSKLIFKGKFPFPWEVFSLCFSTDNSGKLNLYSSALYALKNPIFSIEDELYFVPCSNVFPENNICWGSTITSSNLKQMDNISQAYRFVSMFHDAKFNTDLHPKLAVDKRYEDILREHKDLAEFNYNYLFKTKKKVKDLIKIN